MMEYPLILANEWVLVAAFFAVVGVAAVCGFAIAKAGR
jgi:hypothetical protein